MAVLDQLKLTSATPKRDTTPIGRFRRRLAVALDLQIEIAKADCAGTALRLTRKRWVANETGDKDLREIPLRPRRWWWKDEAGTTHLSLKHGTRRLEIAPGKRAIEVGAIEELPGKLAILREAVLAGELDGCLSAAPSDRDVPKGKKTPGSAEQPASGAHEQRRATAKGNK